MTVGLKENTVEIHEYSASWRCKYLKEESRLYETLTFPCKVEHVGSTSVEGMSAKPIIDIAVGSDSEICDSMIQNVTSCGYVYYGCRDDMGGHIFRKHVGGITTHLLHLVKKGGEQWIKYILLKNLLRENPNVRQEYSNLKKSLSETYSNNRSGYRNAKSKFLEEVYDNYLYGRKIKKISIFGPICSGKSTTATLISNAIGEQVYHLDELFWKREHIFPTKEEWDFQKEKMYCSERWIIDGNYIRSQQDRRISQSDLILYLDTPTAVVVYRFVKACFLNQKRIGIFGRQRDNFNIMLLRNAVLFNLIHRKRILNLIGLSKNVVVVRYYRRYIDVKRIIKRILNEGRE